jgi:dipeptidyl aminopeptidase/acylaminoacyl peptidase
MRRALFAALALSAASLAASSGGNASTSGALSDKLVMVGPWKDGVAVVAVSTSGAVTAVTPSYVPPEFLDASQPTVTRPELLEESVAVSPDGQTVAFTTEGQDGDCCRRPFEGDLFLVRADGSSMRRLTATPDRDESRPVFSPDGRRIAVLQDAALRPADRAKVSLAVASSDGSGVRVVAAAKPGELASNVQVAWHPDGRRLLFYPGLAYSNGPPEHSLLIDLTTGSGRTIYGGPATFSPDGRRLATMWGGEIYVGPLEAFAKRDFARRLRPVVAETFAKTGEKLSSADDFAWLSDGRLAYTSTVATQESGCHFTRTLFGIVDRRGRQRVIGRNVCGWGKLTVNAATSLLLWHSIRLVVSPPSAWRPRMLPARFFPNESYTFGYQASTCVEHGSNGC